MDVKVAHIDEPAQLVLAVEAEHGGCASPAASLRYAFSLGPLPANTSWSLSGIFAAFRSLYDQILPFFAGKAADHQNREPSLQLRCARHLRGTKRVRNTVGDDPQLRAVAMALQLPGDKSAGTVDMVEPVVNTL